MRTQWPPNLFNLILLFVNSPFDGGLGSNFVSNTCKKNKGRQMQARGGALLGIGHGLAFQELVCRIQCTTFAAADSDPQFRCLRHMAWHWVIQYDLRLGTSHNNKYQGCNVSAAQPRR